MKREELRTQYFDDMCRIRDIDLVPDDEINDYFEMMLKCLPNDGLLYKYKALSSFEYVYDSLEKGYIYMPLVTQLNDRIDTTFLYKSKTTEKDVEDYYERNMYKIFRFYLQRDKEVLKRFEKIEIDIIDLFSKGLSHLEVMNNVRTKYKLRINDANNCVQRVKKEVSEVVTKRMKKDNIDLFKGLCANIQGEYRVFSMSEIYNQDSMWAYYCNDNHGICIEYDFKKAKTLDVSKKRKLLDVFRIEYSDKKDEINIFDIFDATFRINSTDDFFFKTNRLLSANLLRKKTSWSQEKEWRIISNRNEDRIPVDIVSKIIVDETILNDDRTKQIIELAKSKGWDITLRRLDLDCCDYVYERLT